MNDIESKYALCDICKKLKCIKSELFSFSSFDTYTFEPIIGRACHRCCKNREDEVNALIREVNNNFD
jgi:hypothetical protein